MTDEKKTVCIRVHVGETLFADLSKLANLHERAVSEYVGLVLEKHAYGHLALVESITGEK